MEYGEISKIVCSDESRRNEESSSICITFIRKINVEPVIILSMIGYGLLSTMQPLFLYWARCVELFSDDGHTNSYSNSSVIELCARLSKNNTLNDFVERDIATWSIYLSLSSSLPTLLVAPLMGAWADGAGGRKKPLIISLFAHTMHGVIQLIATCTYKTQSVYLWLLLSGIITGFSGGYMTMFAACFTIVIDDSRSGLPPGTSNSNVRIRVGIATALHRIASTVGGILASVCTSLFIDERSYILSSFCGAIMILMSLVYAIIFVRETHINIAEFDKSGSTDNQWRSICERGANFCGRIRDQAYSFIQVLSEKREEWSRLCLNLALFFVFVEVLAENSMGLLMLVVKRAPFEWSDTQWTNYSLIRNCMYAVGMVIWPLLIVKTNWLGKDSLLIIFGVFWAGVISVLTAFAQDNMILYVCAGLTVFFGGCSPGFRSFIPRMVRHDETARMMTAFGVVISLCPIISSPIFNTIFKATLTDWPGLVFLIGGILMFAVSGGQLIVHMLMRPLWKRSENGEFALLIVDIDGVDDIVA